MDEIARARQLLYANLTRVAHRKIEPVVSDFGTAMAHDPDFISRACVYLALGGSDVRDTVDAALVALVQASFPSTREAARCLMLGGEVYEIEYEKPLHGLAPFRIFRISDFLRQSAVQAPRFMRSVMADYLHFLEGQPARFDGVALRNRKEMQAAYRHYHIAPGERAQAILFDNHPPADSKLAVLKQIANCKDPVEQARLVVLNQIPYVVAQSILPKISPAVGVALIVTMSPTEAINSRAWVEHSGLLSMPEVRKVYEDKIAHAIKGSVASMQHRKSATGADAGVQKAIDTAKERAVAEGRRIARATLLLVDRSGSMERAISVAQELGSRIAPICDGQLGVFAFNDYAQELHVPGQTLADWQYAFSMIRAGGATAPSAGFDLAVRNGYMPEQVVLITDGGENRGSFADSLSNYRTAAGVSPHIVMVRVPGDSDSLTARIENAGYRLDRFETDGNDYYVYDQIVAILGGPAAKSLVETILETQLPHRVNWKG